jgi:type II secretory pathway pseudopilin PulG
MMFSRDLKRKQNLNSIKEALDTYKQDNNQFPLSEQISKTNDPSTVLSVLVPNYLKKLPVDPNDPNNYYGYTSNGNTYTLTSILDNHIDLEAVKTGNYYLYKLTN